MNNDSRAPLNNNGQQVRSEKSLNRVFKAYFNQPRRIPKDESDVVLTERGLGRMTLQVPEFLMGLDSR